MRNGKGFGFVGVGMRGNKGQVLRKAGVGGIN